MDDDARPTWTEKFAGVIGQGENLRQDALANHDHRLYGVAKGQSARENEVIL